jgi:hypothetical protein
VKAPDGATGVRSLAIDTTGGPARTFHGPSEPTRVRGVRYLSRPAWGADESKRYKDGKVNPPSSTTRCRRSRSAIPRRPTTTRARPRPFGRPTSPCGHLDRGDIGYRFLIDEAGKIYEGRSSGDDGIPAFNSEKRSSVRYCLLARGGRREHPAGLVTGRGSRLRLRQ